MAFVFFALKKVRLSFATGSVLRTLSGSKGLGIFLEFD